MLLSLRKGIQQLKSWGSRLKGLNTDVFAAGPWELFFQLSYSLFCFLFFFVRIKDLREGSLTLGSCFNNFKTRTPCQRVTRYFSLLLLSLLFLYFDI